MKCYESFFIYIFLLRKSQFFRYEKLALIAESLLEYKTVQNRVL